MPKVVIDGVEYVPRAEVPEIIDDRLKRCLQSLTEIQYFSDCPHKHKSWAWDAMNAIAPELAKLSSENPEAAYSRVRDFEV